MRNNGKNTKLKSYAKENNVYLWEIALKMGIAENTLLRKLRVELSDEELSKAMRLVDDISKDKKTQKQTMFNKVVIMEKHKIFKEVHEFCANRNKEPREKDDMCTDCPIRKTLCHDFYLLGSELSETPECWDYENILVIIENIESNYGTLGRNNNNR